MQNTRKIANIYARRDAMHEAVNRFRAGNNAGNGYAWEMPRVAAQILAAETDTEVSVYRLADGSEVAVGDVDGPWAVTITPANGGAR